MQYDYISGRYWTRDILELRKCPIWVSQPYMPRSCMLPNDHNSWRFNIHRRSLWILRKCHVHCSFPIFSGTRRPLFVLSMHPFTIRFFALDIFSRQSLNLLLIICADGSRCAYKRHNAHIEFTLNGNIGTIVIVTSYAYFVFQCAFRKRKARRTREICIRTWCLMPKLIYF